ERVLVDRAGSVQHNLLLQPAPIPVPCLPGQPIRRGRTRRSRFQSIQAAAGLGEADAFLAADEVDGIATDRAAEAVPSPAFRIDVEVGAAAIRVEGPAPD